MGLPCLQAAPNHTKGLPALLSCVGSPPLPPSPPNFALHSSELCVAPPPRLPLSHFEVRVAPTQPAVSTRSMWMPSCVVREACTESRVRPGSGPEQEGGVRERRAVG